MKLIAAPLAFLFNESGIIFSIDFIKFKSNSIVSLLTSLLIEFQGNVSMSQVKEIEIFGNSRLILLSLRDFKQP